MKWNEFLIPTYTILSSYFYSNKKILLLVFISIIYIFCVDKNRTMKQISIYVPIIVFIIAILNPLVYLVCQNYLYRASRAYRYMWLFQNDVIIAYAATRIVMNIKNKKKRVTSVAILIIGIIMCGNIIWFGNTWTAITKNEYRVPQEVIDIDNVISADGREKKVLIKGYYANFLHLYDPDMQLYFSYHNIDGAVSHTLSENPIDFDLVISKMENEGYIYIILEKNSGDNTTQLSEKGYNLIGTTSECNIYRK